MAAVVATVATIASCNKPPPSQNLAEWSAADHDGEKKASATQAPAGSSDPSSTEQALVQATWRAQCAGCHGAAGRGDGPQGKVLAATNLSDPAWQARSSDAAIASAITAGKGKMPRFELPANVLQGLIRHIRSLAEPATGARP